jgi:hypothetical protein
VGTRRPRANASAEHAARTAIPIAALRIRNPETPTYPSRARAKTRLKPRKKRASGPLDSLRGRSSSAESAGESVRALKAEKSTETAIVRANCLFRRPVIPLMKPIGMKTDARITATLTTGAVTSFIAASVASRGERPSSMWRSTASTTTIASSTTSPMASTRPKSERVLTEKPRAGNTMNVPTSDTGTAIRGMSVARQVCRNRKTTSATSSVVSTRVMRISRIPAVTGRVVSREMP